MTVAHAFSIPVDLAVHPQLHKADLQMYDELGSILSSGAVCHTSINMKILSARRTDFCA